MRYLSDKQSKRPHYILYIVSIGIILGTLYTWETVSAFLYARIEPLMSVYGGAKGGVAQSTETVTLLTRSKKDIFEENKTLMLQIEQLENQLAEKNAVLLERNLVDEASSTMPVATIMYPLARDITHLYSTILFSKGTIHGVQVGQIVYVRGMQPVCVVKEVYEKTSLCTLLSKGGESTEAVIVSPFSTSSLAVTLIGEGGGSFGVIIPKDVSVAVGDGVYLRSNQHMKLGTITSIIENEQAIGSKIYIQGSYNPLTSSVFYVSNVYEQ